MQTRADTNRGLATQEASTGLVPETCNRSIRARKVVLLSLLGAVVLIPLAVAVHSVYDTWMDGSVNGFAMWGVFIIYLKTRPARKEWLSVLLAATVLRSLHWVLAAERPYPGYALINIGFYLAFLSIPILVWRAWKGPEKAPYRLSLFGVFLFSYVLVSAGFCISFARMVCRYKLDYLLYAFDGSLGSHLNFILGRISFSHAPFQTAINLTYDSLGLFWALMFASHINRPNNRMNVLKLNVANAIIGFAVFFIYPAMGPRYAFASFPELPASVPLAPALLYGIPNAMPSLHVSTALLTFFLARPSRWLRWITGFYLVMTVLAVFATGEHYMVDAVVAIPYSLMVMAFCSKTEERKPVILVCGGMLTLWLVVLRYGGGNFWISWGLVATTIAVGILTERRFAKVLSEPLPSAALPAA